DDVGMADEIAQLLASLCIPKPRNAIPTACQDVLAVGRERYRRCTILGDIEAAQLCACLDIPEPRRLIVCSCQYTFSVRREGDSEHFVIVLKDTQLRTSFGTP